MSSNNGDATVERHAENKRPPVINDGRITPAILRRYEQAAINFFEQAKTPIPEDRKVAKILCGLSHARLYGWSQNQRDRLVSLSFEDFMADMRKSFLEADWEQTLRRKLVGARMRPQDVFADWSESLLNLNDLLPPPFKLTDEAMREHLLNNITDDLMNECIDRDINDKKDLYEWLSLVKRAESRLATRRKAFGNQEYHHSDSAQPKRRRYDDDYAPTSTSKQPRNQYNQTASSSYQSNPHVYQPQQHMHSQSNQHPHPHHHNPSTTDSDYPRVGPLTDQEREIINNNQGCRRCRLLFCGHYARDCERYPTRGIRLDEALARACKAAWEQNGKRPLPVNLNPSARPNMPKRGSSSNAAATVSTSRIEEVNEEHVAAVIRSAVLTSESEYESE